jgi:hypothetical protein
MLTDIYCLTYIFLGIQTTSTSIEFDEQIDRETSELICNVYQAFKDTIEVQ